jgi:tetratricopeptide (TPR) repeat protein
MLRFVQAGSGYISQSSKWLHFSTPGLDRVDEIEVRWPDGRVQRFAGVETGARYLVRQGAEALQAVARHGEREGVRLQPTTQAAVEQSEVASIGLTWRLPVPTVAVTDFEEREHRIGSGGKPLLVNLWSSWCPSCLHELDQWTREREKLAPALDILALAVDELQADVGEQPARDVIADLGCWFPAGSATDELLLLLEVVQSSVVDRLRQLPVPASFLFDAEGKLARIYKGPVQPEALLADVAKLSLTGMEAAEAALPFEGSWHEGPHLPGFLRIADRLLEQEAPTPAAYFVTAALPYAGDVGETTRARIVQLLARAGNLLIEGKQMEEARALFRQATQIDPMQPALWEKLGLTSTALGDANAALAAYRRATEIDGTRAEGWLAIGVQQMLAGDADAALESLGRAVELNPDLAMGWKGVGRIRCSRGERDAGAAALERALTLAPDDAHAQGLLDACR